MPLTPRELADGLAYWYRRSWPKDLHNAEYKCWAEERPFEDDWWNQRMLPRLKAWKATRPFPGWLIAQNYGVHVTAIRSAWNTVREASRSRDISTLTWNEVCALPNATAVLKPTPSPVFRSKFSHFLFPSVFPVIDNWAMGGARTRYEDYFGRVQEEWHDAPQDELIALLMTHINQSGGELFVGFPAVNKVVELCLIGRRHPQA
jgi:hypothetical protein